MNKPKWQDDLALNSYLSKVADSKPLSSEKECELARRIRTGDQAARDELVEANLRFVISVAREYQNRGVDLNDLINAGNIGLITAAERFDETQGFKFISYAVWWIRQAVLQTLAEQSRIVRIPINRVELLGRIRKELNRESEVTGDIPTPEEVAQALGVSVDEVMRTLSDGRSILSLDATFRDDDDNTLADILSDDTQEGADELLFRNAMADEVDWAVSTLKDREAEILRLYFGLGDIDPLTLEEIGVKLGITRERVRQIKEVAIQKLRHASRSRRLRPYIDDTLDPEVNPPGRSAVQPIIPSRRKRKKVAVVKSPATQEPEPELVPTPVSTPPQPEASPPAVDEEIPHEVIRLAARIRRSDSWLVFNEHGIATFVQLIAAIDERGGDTKLVFRDHGVFLLGHMWRIIDDNLLLLRRYAAALDAFPQEKAMLILGRLYRANFQSRQTPLRTYKFAQIGQLPENSPSSAELDAIEERIRSGNGGVELHFADAWIIWQYISSRQQFITRLRYDTVHGLLRAIRQFNGDVRKALTVGKWHITDERLIEAIERYLPALEMFAVEINDKTRQLSLSANPPDLDYLKNLGSWPRLGIETHEELVALVASHHGHVGRALYGRAAVSSGFVIVVMAYLRSRGVPIIEFEADPEKRVRIMMKPTDEDATTQELLRVLRSEIDGGRSPAELLAAIRSCS